MFAGVFSLVGSVTRVNSLFVGERTYLKEAQTLIDTWRGTMYVG